MITMAEKYRTGRALRPFSFIGVVTYTIAAHTADLAKGLMCVLADKVATGSVFFTYHLSSVLSANHGLSMDVEMIAEMTGALEN
ncbi:hypothetical protein [Aliamphritea spongicola]|uniref:hypothetical protein n=1 Tax=Aliamphritea spongicola TaxID=707589 RepID=UPI00196AEC42|nr:hypothetical protein [Aliamphritea spongicola]MBN3562782.1 hypothetical protein [Aliamphritea spongicola]